MAAQTPVVLLAGGLGTRLSEETGLKPKPMVEIGGRPILWHIMKRYAGYGFREFLVAAGYKGQVIKRHFRDYHALHSECVSVSLSTGQIEIEGPAEDWLVRVVDTGHDSMTGGRVGRLRRWLSGGPFFLTYGDGVCDLDLRALLAFHREQGRLATVTAVRPPARFGGLVLEGGEVKQFTEKPQVGEGWINGGFMVLEPAVLDMIPADETRLEQDVLEILAEKGQLSAYRHDGFWQCMDTLRDVRLLNRLYSEGSPPWLQGV
tara:strand:- start:892 stop:1674 length:783 start_codon:yes stop_codon:yes gene_type:complete